MKQNEWFQCASEYLPGGVCSSARVHKAINQPIYISRAEGSRVYDLEGKAFPTSFESTPENKYFVATYELAKEQSSSEETK